MEHTAEYGGCYSVINIKTVWKIKYKIIVHRKPYKCHRDQKKCYAEIDKC